eukprot:1557608-Pleurochrysis_carterae.AAC.2
MEREKKETSERWTKALRHWGGGRGRVQREARRASPDHVRHARPRDRLTSFAMHGCVQQSIRERAHKLLAIA